METKLNKISEQLEKLDSRLDSIDITLVRNTKDIETHIKRTDLLEQELGPIKAHVAVVSLGFKGIAWFCAAIAGLAGFIYILKDLGVFNG